ncbi:NAD(P)-binding protein [Paxillus ammoniavirescens]|nr:NAD(P)-binding protein [Paxillus ammoniavirescens]
MSQNLFKSFAVLGAGTLGLPLAKELLANGASVLIVTRPSSKHRKIPAEATHVSVDFTDVQALSDHFRRHNCEVVISAVNHYHLEVQPPTLEAAKNAGVKLYLPSDYGFPSEGQDGILAQKSEFVDRIKATGIPYTRLYCGLLMDFIPFFLGIDWDGRATLIGKGDKAASFTALPDVTGFLAYVLTHLPPQDLYGRTLRIEGQRYSLGEVAGLYGDNITVVHAPRFPDDIDDPRLREYLQEKVEAGAGTVTYNFETGKDDYKLDNDLWPGHRWQTVEETLGL